MREIRYAGTMSHHAYLVTGDIEDGVTRALSYAERAYNISTEGNTDVTVLRHGLFSVEDARTLLNLAQRRPLAGEVNVIVIATTRFFHEAQNALLKLFEEPPTTTRLFLIVPSEGNIIPTLRSRLVPLPGIALTPTASAIAEEFIDGTAAAREKIVAKLLDRAKSDKDAEKAAARADAVALVEGLIRTAYAKQTEKSSPALTGFLSDLDRFLPILHERSAPLKLIFEHILLTIPRGLGSGKPA